LHSRAIHKSYKTTRIFSKDKHCYITSGHLSIKSERYAKKYLYNEINQIINLKIKAL